MESFLALCFVGWHSGTGVFDIALYIDTVGQLSISQTPYSACQEQSMPDLQRLQPSKNLLPQHCPRPSFFRPDEMPVFYAGSLRGPRDSDDAKSIVHRVW